jgi:hypothetical protein
VNLQRTDDHSMICDGPKRKNDQVKCSWDSIPEESILRKKLHSFGIERFLALAKFRQDLGASAPSSTQVVASTPKICLVGGNLCNYDAHYSLNSLQDCGYCT